VLEFLRVRDDLLVHEVLHRAQDLLLDVGETGGLGKAGHEVLQATFRGSIPRKKVGRPSKPA
jgi:hypothetical protein